MGSLKSAPVKVTAPHTPVPAAANLEQLYAPDAAAIEAAVRRVLG
jgi:pyruvate/2-oxoglutarate/acetoin dehydrogenase E1 component